MSERFRNCQPSAMDRATFVATFGGIYEHSPWIAEQAWERGVDRRHDTIGELHALLSEVFLGASSDEQLAVIRAHPDLAGRAAVSGEMSASSNREQASAGLDACTPVEYERFQRLNRAYQARFGFPFIMAVKGKRRGEILAAFEARLQNSPQRELQRALAEINTIARLRLNEL